jgi:hypothetical protein
MPACSSDSFGYGLVQSMLESNPVSLDGEQVMLTDNQVQCGVQADLWDVTQLSTTRAIARLNQGGRDLNFGDDVIIGEPGTRMSYVQIRGSFKLHMVDLGDIRDDGQKFKLADVKVAVEIPHSCFHDPMPQLMAVRRGKFTQEAYPTFRFRMDSAWVYDRVQH